MNPMNAPMPEPPPRRVPDPPPRQISEPPPQVPGSPSPPVPDLLPFGTGAVPARDKTAWLVAEVRRAIAEGRLTPGDRLPPSRTLATALGLSRGAVTEAYRRLTEDGHVEGRGRRGTVVRAVPRAVPPPRTSTPPPADPFAPATGEAVFDALRELPARIDLTPGRPDLTAFPRAAWLRATRAVLAELPTASLGYGDPRGEPALRTSLAHWLARTRGLLVHPDDLLVVSGAAQALSLLGPVLRAEGIDQVALEDPGSLGVRQHLRRTGFATPPVPVDHAGIRVDDLRATGARAVLLTPAHQFPTGVVTRGARRRALLRWASEGGLVLEDDYDAEHRYDRAPVPALRTLLADRVCYLGSASKLLAPALRLGWLVPPPHLRDALVEAKRFADLGNDVLAQHTFARLIDSGDLERHVRQSRTRHRRRRDAMIAALARHLPHAVVHGAAAGLHLTLTLDTPVPDTDVAAAALARGVKVQPLSWHRVRPGPPGLVLGYAAVPATAIEEGVAALGASLRDLA
ncbi:GntR family transcriptional regulator / MocR family aminotransferase [Streptomyces sp. LcepLS]|nr:GntR family transcriptional regulator / MocR family aminotransferase [Streptomyces sp. LcepLS]